MAWFAVRCIFKQFQVESSEDHTEFRYEERITLWKAVDAEEAIALAEEEAVNYAALALDEPDTYLGFAQSYELYDNPSEVGSEVFSLIRGSTLDPEEYISHFYDTGDERGTTIEGK